MFIGLHLHNITPPDSRDSSLSTESRTETTKDKLGPLSFDW